MKRAAESLFEQPAPKRLCVDEDVVEDPLPGLLRDVNLGRGPAARAEPEPGPSHFQPGLTPSEWGELMGVYSASLEEEPIVLHCFETLGESDQEDAA